MKLPTAKKKEYDFWPEFLTYLSMRLLVIYFVIFVMINLTQSFRHLKPNVSLDQGEFNGIYSFRGLSRHSARSYEPSKKGMTRELLKLPGAVIPGNRC